MIRTVVLRRSDGMRTGFSPLPPAPSPKRRGGERQLSAPPPRSGEGAGGRGAEQARSSTPQGGRRPLCGRWLQYDKSRILDARAGRKRKGGIDGKEVSRGGHRPDGQGQLWPRSRRRLEG